mmetsp:Transcript_81214/g.224811  ORF Transcript_81214/g.224811 Transcript_81214/m.224811 type:complete len:273 (+) Transcript_81214:561-1379(+)
MRQPVAKSTSPSPLSPMKINRASGCMVLKTLNRSAFFSPMALWPSLPKIAAWSTAPRSPASSPASTTPASKSSRRVCASTTCGRAVRKVTWPPRALSSGLAPGTGPCGNLGPPQPKFPTQKVMSTSESTCSGRSRRATASPRKCASNPSRRLRSVTAPCTRRRRSMPFPAVPTARLSSTSCWPEVPRTRSWSSRSSGCSPTLASHASRSISAPASRARAGTLRQGSAAASAPSSAPPSSLPGRGPNTDANGACMTSSSMTAALPLCSPSSSA